MLASASQQLSQPPPQQPQACAATFVLYRATIATELPTHAFEFARETAIANPGVTVYVPGCWPADSDIASRHRTHGEVSSVRTLGLQSSPACSEPWRLRHLSSHWARSHKQDTAQATSASVDVLTAAAARRILPPACAGGDPLRLAVGNASLSRAFSRRRTSRSGPGCVALVVEPDVVLLANAVRLACTYYDAEAYDAVLQMALPTWASRIAAGGRHAARLSDTCAGASSRHFAFLSLKALDALSTLALLHAPRFRQHAPHPVCPIDQLLPMLLPAHGISALWLAGTAPPPASKPWRNRMMGCGMFLSGASCRAAPLTTSPATTSAQRHGSRPSAHQHHGRRLGDVGGRVHGGMSGGDDSAGATGSTGRSHRERASQRLHPRQYGCTAVAQAADGRCLLPPLGAQPTERLMVLDDGLWDGWAAGSLRGLARGGATGRLAAAKEPRAASDASATSVCGRGSLRCAIIGMREVADDGSRGATAYVDSGGGGSRVCVTPRLMVRADERIATAAAVVGEYVRPTLAVSHAGLAAGGAYHSAEWETPSWNRSNTVRPPGHSEEGATTATAADAATTPPAASEAEATTRRGDELGPSPLSRRVPVHFLSLHLSHAGASEAATRTRDAATLSLFHALSRVRKTPTAQFAYPAIAIAADEADANGEDPPPGRAERLHGGRRSRQRKHHHHRPPYSPTPSEELLFVPHSVPLAARRSRHGGAAGAPVAGARASESEGGALAGGKGGGTRGGIRTDRVDVAGGDRTMSGAGAVSGAAMGGDSGALRMDGTARGATRLSSSAASLELLASLLRGAGGGLLAILIFSCIRRLCARRCAERCDPHHKWSEGVSAGWLPPTPSRQPLLGSPSHSDRQGAGGRRLQSGGTHGAADAPAPSCAQRLGTYILPRALRSLPTACAPAATCQLAACCVPRRKHTRTATQRRLCCSKRRTLACLTCPCTIRCRLYPPPTAARPASQRFHCAALNHRRGLARRCCLLIGWHRLLLVCVHWASRSDTPTQPPSL